ncbi:hypothetical protein ACFQ0O_02480 [Saccharopolyspora spinosporotrichia]
MLAAPAAKVIADQRRKEGRATGKPIRLLIGDRHPAVYAYKKLKSAKPCSNSATSSQRT